MTLTSTYRCLLRVGLVLTALFLTGSPSSEADTLTEGGWKDAKKEASRLMGQPGVLAGKTKAIKAVAHDDSARAAEVLIEWAKKSLKLQSGALAKELGERKKAFDRVLKVLKKAYKVVPPVETTDDGRRIVRWKATEHRQSYETAKTPYDKALDNYDAEEHVRYELGRSLEGLRDEAAVRWLIGDGLKSLSKLVRKGKHGELVLASVVRCLTNQPDALVEETLLGFAIDAKAVRARIVALGWLGQKQIASGFSPIADALRAKEVAVRRAAVAAAVHFDDPRFVKPLIDSLEGADGLLATDIEDAIHNYVGLSMEGSFRAWSAWWENEGAAWLAEETITRHGRVEKKRDGGYGFYGIETDSERIVFVMDRSGSMNTPADPASKRTKPKDDKPDPVVTGPGGGNGGGGKDQPPPVVEGETKIEVAKSQLGWAIKQLPKDTLFGVVFYASGVDVWRDPPELLPANPANRKAAIEWFTEIEATGSTSLFDALMKALDYANTLEGDAKRRNLGADTIFLLSDGSPTDKNDGKRVLTPEEIEAAMVRFHAANEVYKCVVHTIGVGKAHNVPLMQRIARETGGTYRRAGEW